MSWLTEDVSTAIYAMLDDYAAYRMKNELRRVKFCTRPDEFDVLAYNAQGYSHGFCRVDENDFLAIEDMVGKMHLIHPEFVMFET